MSESIPPWNQDTVWKGGAWCPYHEEYVALVVSGGDVQCAKCFKQGRGVDA